MAGNGENPDAYDFLATQAARSQAERNGQLDTYLGLVRLEETSGGYSQERHPLSGTTHYQFTEWIDTYPDMTPEEIYQLMYPAWTPPGQ